MKVGLTRRAMGGSTEQRKRAALEDAAQNAQRVETFVASRNLLIVEQRAHLKLDFQLSGWVEWRCQLDVALVRS
jgi:hypothetical protein